MNMVCVGSMDLQAPLYIREMKGESDGLSLKLNLIEGERWKV